MASEHRVIEVRLRRSDTSQSWGFRMKGGLENGGIPLYIEHVNPNGRSAKAGLSAGDVILSICNVQAQRMTHQQAKQEMLRAGNELDFVVAKHAMPLDQIQQDGANRRGSAGMRMGQSQEEDGAEGERVEIVEENTIKLGGPTYKNIKPKTYQILEDELDSGRMVKNNPTMGPGPASIFDRKKDDRSEYLQAKGKSIQRAYGEKH